MKKIWLTWILILTAVICSSCGKKDSEAGLKGMEGTWISSSPEQEGHLGLFVIIQIWKDDDTWLANNYEYTVENSQIRELRLQHDNFLIESTKLDSGEYDGYLENDGYGTLAYFNGKNLYCDFIDEKLPYERVSKDIMELEEIEAYIQQQLSDM